MKETLEYKINSVFNEMNFRAMFKEPLALNLVNARVDYANLPVEATEKQVTKTEQAKNKAARDFLADTKPKIVMICGSRNMDTRAIYERVTFLLGQIRRWHEPRKWSIICGDAIGIDTFVVKECVRLQIPLKVYGVQSKPRIQPFPDAPNITYEYMVNTSYTERDRHMARICDYGLFFWNGSSRGTKANYDYTNVTLGKPVLLLNPNNVGG